MRKGRLWDLTRRKKESAVIIHCSRRSLKPDKSSTSFIEVATSMTPMEQWSSSVPAWRRFARCCLMCRSSCAPTARFSAIRWFQRQRPWAWKYVLGAFRAACGTQGHHREAPSLVPNPRRRGKNSSLRNPLEAKKLGAQSAHFVHSNHEAHSAQRTAPTGSFRANRGEL